MADIIVDVSLPNPITTDVTSPTQALATNISVPGPQGPTGPKGNPTTINSLGAENIIITGANGNIVSNNGISIIYISGNSGYFQSAVNILTTNLENTGSNLYTLLTNFSGNLDANYATDLQLYNTGSTLDNKINSLSGWSASVINLQQTGENLYSLLINFSGNLDANYASDAQLFTTGSTLDTKINSLSGYVDIQDNSILLNLNSTGSILDNKINSLSGYSASIVNLASTGSALDSKINSLSGYSASINNLQSTGSNLYSMLIGFSGDLDATYATDSQLATTGSSLDTKINSLSGYSASAVNLASTGSNLYTLITNFSGNLDADFASQAEINALSGYVNSQDISISNNLISTGSTLDNKINSLSGALTGNYITKSNGQFIDRPTVNGTGILLSGEAASLPTTILYTTGNQIKSGRLIIGDTIVDASYPYTLSLQSNTPETWLEILNHSGANQGVFFGIDDNNFEQWNSQAGDILFVTSENPMDGTERLRIKNDGKVGIGTSAPSEKLEVAGNIIANNLVYNTGNQTISGNKTLINNIYVSGTGYFQNINISNLNELVLSGARITIGGNSGVYSSTNIYISGNPVLTGVDLSSYAITTNLILTGSTLDSKINNLSGYINTQDNSISNNLTSTGTTLNNKINSLSGVSVLTYGDQIVVGTKYFNEDVYIHNLYVTGDEFIANVTNNFVESPYLLLNITGGAIDGGIFFVTGSGFTGINDYGPIIGFDHSNKFKIGVARRSDDLSFLPDIASVQQIEAYSGVANNTFSTITNLYNTGSNLNNKINSLSGWSASALNLASTGSTLDSKINSLSGWSASAANLASSGSTLNTRINNLSGYINSSSSNIVFTTGNQTISGIKTFIQDTTFGDSAQGDFLVISGNNFTVYGSGNFTSGLFVNSSPVLTGSSTLYATTVNLASTGSTLDNKINNLSGVSVLRFGDQTISGNKTFINRLSASTGFFGDNIFAFGNWIGISAGSGNYASGDYAFIGGGQCNRATATYATVGGGASNFASGISSTIGGGQRNGATAANSNVGGGCGNCAVGNYSNVGGGCLNCALGNSSTIGGGFRNCAIGNCSNIGGGSLNCATAASATIGGGNRNCAIGNCSTIGGGCYNTASGAFSNIDGGYRNITFGDCATVGGGACNRACCGSATIGGGCCNTASGACSFLGGGFCNSIVGIAAIIVGGCCNSAIGDCATVGGGACNRACCGSATIGGGCCNTACANFATVGGGCSNTASVNNATVGGGGCNAACNSFATIGGGCYNRANGTAATVGGGCGNCAVCASATVGGGCGNRACCDFATVGGGCCNFICSTFTTIGGGVANCACGSAATVGGGATNRACLNFATVAGGCYNRANGTAATVGGGYRNAACNSFATVGGGSCNSVLAEYSYILGGRCSTIISAHSGAAVLGDGQLRPHNSFSAHSLTLDFKSGVYFAQPYIYGSGSGSLEFLSPLLAPNLVYNTGNQTISGVKTFIGNHNISGNLNVTGNSNIIGTLSVAGLFTTSGSGIFTSGIDLNNSKLINATPDLLNVSANFNITGTQNSRVILANSPTIITGSIVSGNPIGFNTSIIQISSGQVLITGSGSNVIVSSYNNQFRTAAQYATISILHTGNDGYIMYGNTST